MFGAFIVILTNHSLCKGFILRSNETINRLHRKAELRGLQCLGEPAGLLHEQRAIIIRLCFFLHLRIAGSIILCAGFLDERAPRVAAAAEHRLGFVGR